MNGKHQFGLVRSRMCCAVEEDEGTPVYLIAFTAEGLAIWDGADRDKRAHGLVCRGGKPL
jgi:hypothetical protein